MPLSAPASGDLGFDIDPLKIDKLNAGKSILSQIPDATICRDGESRFEATDRLPAQRTGCRHDLRPHTVDLIAMICNLTYVIDSAKAVALCLRPGQLVVSGEHNVSQRRPATVVLPIL